MTRRRDGGAAVRKVEVEGGVKAPDLSRVTDTIHGALGKADGSVGKALVEGLMSVSETVVGSVNAQLDGLRADASAARELARTAGTKADQAAHDAAEAVASARTAGTNAENAAGSAQGAAESAETAQRAAADVRESIRSLSITVGEKTYDGDEALSQMSSILSSLAAISVQRGESTTVTGVDAVADVIGAVEALTVTRGASTIKGPDALRELVHGLASIEVTITKPAVGDQPATSEKVTGIDALILLCGKVDNLETDFVGRTDTALSTLLSARVVVGSEADGNPKVETLTGSKLLMHVVRVVDGLSENLSGEVKQAVDDTFTARVSIDGKPTKLSGAALAKYLVEIAETARAAAGTAVRRSEEEARKAAVSAEEARLAADGAYKASDEAGKKADVLEEAIKVVDEKLAVLAELVTAIAEGLGVTEFVSKVLGGTAQVSDVAALVAQPSIEKPGEPGGKTG